MGNSLEKREEISESREYDGFEGIYSDKLKYDVDLTLINENYKSKLKELVLSNIKSNANDIPTTYEFAKMASLSYKDLKVEDSLENLPGWSLLTTAINTNNLFNASVFINESGGQIVIAHRGSKLRKRVFVDTNYFGIYKNNFVSQMSSACTLAHKIHEALHDEINGTSNWKISFTGHSLGGWLSQLTTFSMKFMKLHKEDQIFLPLKKTEPGYESHTEVFESPGFSSMLEKFKDTYYDRYGEEIEVKCLDITIFLSSPNVVNCCNKHVGKIFRIFPKISKNSKYPVYYVLNSHNMDNILETLDSRTAWFKKNPNVLCKIKEVIDWPVIQVNINLLGINFGAEYNEFFDHASMFNDFHPMEDDKEFKKTRYKTKLFPQTKQSSMSDFEALESIHYIDRIFKQEKIMSKEFFENLKGDDKFAVAGIRENRSSLPNSMLKAETHHDFKMLCENNIGKNVHWLKFDSNRYIWKQTRGDLKSIRKYLDENLYDTYSEGELLSQKNEDKILIISAVPGMGKSTVMSSLTRYLTKDYQHLWTFRINLNDCSSVLRKALDDDIKFSKNYPVQAIEFFLNEILSSTNGTKLTNLEKRLLKKCFLDLGGFVLLIDAFDEICPLYDNLILELIGSLRNTKVDKIILTTRPHKRDVLENYFTTLSYTMEPFIPDDIINFLVRFWNHSLPSIAKEKLEQYAKTSLENFSRSIKDQESKFTGIPLQCKLLGNFMLDKINTEVAIPETFNLYDLYKHFVDNKFNIYECKNPGSKGHPSASAKDDVFNSILRDLHTKYALELLFSDETCESLDFQPSVNDKLKKKSEGEVLKIGLIQELNLNVQFKHQSYAEFLIFEYILELSNESKSKKKKLKTMSGEILLKSQFGIIRSFIESFMKKDSDLLNPFFTAHAETISKKWKENKQICLNEINDTVLHVLLREGNFLSFAAILGIIRDKCDEGIFSTLINVSNKDGNTALHVSAYYGSFSALTLLLESGADINVMNNEMETPIHLACKKGQDKIVQKLIENNCDIKTRSSNGMSPLLEASQYGHENTISQLIKSGSDITCSNKFGWSAIHYASRYGYFNLLKQLIEADCKLNVRTDEGQNPMHLVAANGYLDMLLLFINKECDVNVLDNKGWSALHFAATNGQRNVIDLLIQNNCAINAIENNGWSALHMASAKGHADLILPLIKSGHKIFHNNNGLGPIHLAAANGHIDVVQILIENGSEVNDRDSKGRSPLHYASENGQISTVQFLLKTRCEVNACSEQLESPLHLAAQNGQHEIVSILIKGGCEKNALTDQKHTALHIASQLGNLETVKVLIEEKCLIDEPDEDDWTPLHLASLNGHNDVAIVLLDKGAKIEALANDNTGHGKGSEETPLHFAAKGGHSSTVSLLLSRGANADAKNSNNKTPLELAVENNNSAVASVLIYLD